MTSTQKSRMEAGDGQAQNGEARRERQGVEAAPESRIEPVGVVCVGASAGGLQAFNEFLQALPADTGMAFVVIQHLAADQESALSRILARSTAMPVIEVHDQPVLEPNCVYVIPPNCSILAVDGRLSLISRAPGAHHPIDIFLNALAASHGHRAIGVILSGTATDGTLGLEAVKAAGGITFAQDRTATHAGMPQNAIDAGCVDFVLSPREIAAEISRLSRDAYVAWGGADAALDTVGADPLRIDPILTLLRNALGVDFAQYKPSTLHRRIRRRMALRKVAGLDAYHRYLAANPAEIESLYEDILLSVTNFFRNPDCFEALRVKVFPRLFEQPIPDDGLRLWVLGCSTGEEAYSLAIALSEYREAVQSASPLVVYATDINATAVDRARKGWYPRRIAQDVSEQRLRRYFVESSAGYAVSKAIRDMCIFARHNALTDPPFSRMDLVSCRNMLIYLQLGLQRKMLSMLHYALKPGRFLFLGPSENITHKRELFQAEDAKHKIFSKRPVQKRAGAPFPIAPRGELSAARAVGGAPEAGHAVRADPQRDAERALIQHYVPPGVLVDAEGEVLQFRGETGPFLAPAPGKASLNLLKMAREGMLAPLRTLLLRARSGEAPLRDGKVQVGQSDGILEIAVSVIPVSYGAPPQPCYWVMFERGDSPLPSRARRRRGTARSAEGEEAERQIRLLTQELVATREYLEATIELQGTAHEELQSANEEVQSANEELQSTNEELETSKEEIQASNEELSTVNEELRVRNEELDRANDDLSNIFSSVQLAIVMVGNDLRIRRFTPLAERVFNIIGADVGRSIAEIKPQVDIPDLPQLLADSIDRMISKEREARGSDGRWYLLRIRPYRTLENRIDGAVIILIDVDTLAQTKERLRKRIEELSCADRQKNEFLAILAHELRNPLAPLRNAAQILKLSPSDQAVSTKARELIERQVKNMSRLVGDLLDAARVARGQVNLQLERLDLRSVAELAVETMRGDFDARHQKLAVSLPAVPVPVDGDATRLEQILSNLLSNASKYTRHGGHIRLSMEMPEPTAAEGASVIVRVIDDGDGIDPELMPRLFELFTQADRSLAHAQGGLGIGLSLVRTLVELHSGTVVARSEGHDRGSEFVVRLPLKRTLPEQATLALSDFTVPAPQTADAGRRRLLVVDDNADVAESSAMMLTLAGYDVKTAFSGGQALQIVDNFQPAAVLLDIGLPDINGYQVARELRQRPDLASVRLIAVSGYDTPEARLRAIQAGFDHHVSKPVTLAALQALLGP